MIRNFENNQPVMLKPANQEGEARPSSRPVSRPPARLPTTGLSFAATLSAFWIGVWGAYL